MVKKKITKKEIKKQADIEKIKEDKKFVEKLKVDRALEKLEEKQEIISQEESESFDLENLVNVSTPRFPISNPTRFSPMLELSEENQLETDLANIPTPNQATENAAQPDNTPRYTQGSASLYQGSSYETNARNYDESGYPKLISAPELNRGPGLGFSSNSNPSLGLRSSNDLASNEYPGMIQDESKKYEPPNSQKPDRRRY